MSGPVPPLSQCALVAWCSFKKHMDKFNFTLLHKNDIKNTVGMIL
jgi:hypothetical protein